MASGVIGICCWVTSSTATYFGNPSGNYKDLYWNDSSANNYAYTTWPTSDMQNWTVTSVDVEICGNEVATSAWTGDIYLGSYYLGTFSYPKDSAQGANWSSYQTLSGTSNLTLAGITAMNQSALTASIRYCSSSSTGNKFYTKSSYAASWIYIHYEYSTNNPPSDQPSVYWPAAHNTYTYKTYPNFAVDMPTDPEGDSLQLAWGIYDYTDSTWIVPSSWGSTWYNPGDFVTMTTSVALPIGHQLQIQCYARDTSYEEPSSGSNYYKRFYIVVPTSVDLSAGAKFDDSHIDNLQTDISVVAPYYGWGTPSFTTINLGTKGLASHMNEIDDALYGYFPYTSHFYTDNPDGDISSGLKINATLYNAARTQLLKC